MTTACWATNKSFDCATVTYGYGSVYDMICSMGYQLSLEGILILAQYDYSPLRGAPMGLDKKDPKQSILIKEFGLNENLSNSRYVDVPDELISKFPLEIQMEWSTIHIKHPEGLDKSLEWFKILLDNPSNYEYNPVSLEEIASINPYHYECIKRVHFMENQANTILNLVEKQNKWMENNGIFRATDEDLKQLLVSFEQERVEEENNFKARTGDIWKKL